MCIKEISTGTPNSRNARQYAAIDVCYQFNNWGCRKVQAEKFAEKTVDSGSDKRRAEILTGTPEPV